MKIRRNSINHHLYLVTSLSLKVVLISFNAMKFTMVRVLPVTSNTFTHNFCSKLNSNGFKRSEFFLIMIIIAIVIVVVVDMLFCLLNSN